MSQRNDYEIDFLGGSMYMNSDFGFDYKQAKPVVAKVLQDFGQFKEGDIVICHHNSFNRTSGGWNYGDTGEKVEGEAVFVLEESMVQMKIVDGEAFPVRGFLTVERIDKEVKTDLVVPDSFKKKEEMRFKVLRVGEDCLGIEEGMTIFAYKKSDYELPYVWNGKIKTAIRVDYNDVLGYENL
jgi:hypothetical protein